MEAGEWVLRIELGNGIVDRHSLGELVVEGLAILELYTVLVRAVTVTDLGY